jgi:hypothetical protein
LLLLLWFVLGNFFGLLQFFGSGGIAFNDRVLFPLRSLRSVSEEEALTASQPCSEVRRVSDRSIFSGDGSCFVVLCVFRSENRDSGFG